MYINRGEIYKRDIQTYKSKINRHRHGEKKERNKRQTTVYTTQHGKPKPEQQETHQNPVLWKGFT